MALSEIVKSFKTMFPVPAVVIVKSAFEAVFGIGAKPQMRDYLYFKLKLLTARSIGSVLSEFSFLYLM